MVRQPASTPSGRSAARKALQSWSALRVETIRSSEPQALHALAFACIAKVVRAHAFASSSLAGEVEKSGDSPPKTRRTAVAR